MMCSRCKKRMAVVFMTRLEGNETINEGLCIQCAKELGIKRLSEQGIKKEDFDMLADDVVKEPVRNFNPRQGITKEDVLAILEKAY